VSIDPNTWIPTTDRAPTGKFWPRGYRNGNPGNIDYSPASPWQGLADPPLEPKPLDGSRRRFCRFTAAAWGVRTIFRVLITYRDRKAANGTPVDTIAEIVARWAPAIENNVVAYVNQVDAAHPAGKDDVLDVRYIEDALPLAKAIVRHELGDPREFGLSEWYPEEVWERGAFLAGLKRRNPKPVTKDTDLVAGGGAAVLAGVSAADGLGLVKQYVEPGSVAAQVVGVLAVIAVVYLIVRRLKQRKREAT
jgi:hypothetical protein